MQVICLISAKCKELMKSFASITLLITALLNVCSSWNTTTSVLFATIRLEEKQNNNEHATKFYSKKFSTYQTSSAAKEAVARLDILKSNKP